MARFEIVGRLGEGSYGAVYAALDIESGERVALKELTRTSPSALTRFKQEFRALQGVHHPNLVELREIHEQHGHWYIVMELVEGVELREWILGPTGSRPDDAQPDLDRLRQALIGVAEGLVALHGHGFVHRDLKPSNILITPEGRAVVLDFGLAIEHEPDAQPTEAGAQGTAEFMAPEQAASETVGPAADFYALGGVLYEALTGRPPFTGANALHIIMQKQNALPAPPSTLVSHVPADLEELCMALLVPVPEQRPSAAEIIRRLSHTGRFAVQRSLPPSLAPASFFTGREHELARLKEALDRTHRGELSIVLIEGESGLGKSALVSELLRRQRLEQPEMWTLRGRCYQNELIPYKAFDGCIDVLAKILRRLPLEHALSLLPQRAALLSQLFPVLSSVNAVSRASAQDVAADPTARRLEAFAALNELLGRIAEERPLVLVIDDVQWADAESFRLLRALVESDSAPLLLVMTARPRHEQKPDVEQELDVIRSWPCTRVLSLRGLSRADAQSLATALLGPEAPPRWAGMIARESLGNPLLITELVEYALSRPSDDASIPTLDAALSARIVSLDPAARRLLELLSLSGRPETLRLLQRANGSGAIDAEVRKLLAQRFVRRHGAHALTCAHDSVRRVVEAAIDEPARPKLHRALAQALSAEQADPGEQAPHWEAAHELVRASEAYASAAEEALHNLAFKRAEELFARALSLMPHTASERGRELTVKRGHALAGSGRSKEAAELYQEVAKCSDGEARVRLRVLAAQHLIQAAEVKAGLSATREVLAEVGVATPSSTAAALLHLGWERTILGVRGYDRPTRSEVAESERLALDAMRALRVPLGWVDLLPGAVLNTQYLRRSLASGSSEHVADALAQEASFRAMQSPENEGAYRPLFERARELSEASSDPALKAVYLFMAGTAAIWTRNFQNAREQLESAQAFVQTQCPGEAWLLTNIRMNLGSTYWILGTHRRMSEQGNAWMREARERGDRFAITALSALGQAAMRHLVIDEPTAALAELDEALAPWPKEPFTLAHLGEMLGVCAAENYRGGEGGTHWLKQQGSRLDRAFILRASMLVDGYCGVISASKLTLAATKVGAERAAIVNEVAQLTRRVLSGRGKRSIRPLARSIDAQLSALTYPQLGRERLAAVRASAAKANENFLAHAMSYVDGLLEGGEAGRTSCDTATAFFREQGWKQPWRAIAMFAPIIRILEEAPLKEHTRSSGFFSGRYVLDAREDAAFVIGTARDTRTGRRVELKRLLRVSPEALARFKREFRVLEELHHPALARLEALFEHRGEWFIAREYVEGVDFLSWVRPNGKLDEARLRGAFTDLVRAVAVLHDAGFAHRDIHPKSVRVAPDGRVTLLDFGLVAHLDEVDEGTSAGAAGTAHYFAPEQIEGGEVHVAADVYALGVCLYQALIGLLPYDARTHDGLVQAKRLGRPVPPAVYEPRVPSDLDELCMHMLMREPSLRPSLEQVLAALTTGQPDKIALRGPSHAPLREAPHARHAEELFAGRVRELEALDAALKATRAGERSILVIEGESGMGKTALVSEFLERIEKLHPDAWIFRGRCYENEQLPYKAFDAAIDELARELRKLPPHVCKTLLPSRAWSLTTLFPVLGSVSSVAATPRKGIAAEALAQRLQAFEALRRLLQRCAAERPLIFAIDDLHWADAESFRLLRALMHEAQAPQVLMIFTARKASDRSEEAEKAIDAVCTWAETRRMPLAALSAEEAEAMASALLEGSAPESWLRAIVEESGGHPLFLRELVRHAQSGVEPHQDTCLTLDDALRARVNALDERARTVLELVSLCENPVGPHVILRALEDTRRATQGQRATSASSSASDVHEALAVLTAQRLVRRRGGGDVMCFHDRLRQVVANAIPSEQVAALSELLATALAAEPDASPAQLARLWDQGKRFDFALRAYERAGDQALDVLAFAKASQLYARAIELKGRAHDEQLCRLHAQRGWANSRSGRAKDAAQDFRIAGMLSEGEARTRFRVLAAQQLIQGAEVQAGLQEARALLSELDVALPASTPTALARLLWERANMPLGTPKVAEPPGKLDPMVRLKLDAMHALLAPVGWVDMLPGSALNMRHLRLSLLAGEPGHAARALGQEAALRAMQRPDRPDDYEPVLKRAHQLAESSADRAARAYSLLMEATVATFSDDQPRARSVLENAYEVVLSECPDESWLLTNIRMNLGAVLFALGEHAQLAELGAAWLAEARERDDRFAIAALTGLGHIAMRHLMNDDPAAAREELRDAMAPWPAEPFTLAHVGELSGTSHIDLYVGGPVGYQRMLEAAPRHRRAFPLKLRLLREATTVLRTALSLAAMHGASEPRRKELEREVKRASHALQRRASQGATAWAIEFEASLAALNGNVREARALIERASVHWHKLGNKAKPPALRYLDGLLEGGENGAELREGALAHFRAQTWKNPESAIALFVPVVRLLT